MPFTFLGMALVACQVVGANRKAIDDMGGKSEDAVKYFRFFKERYQQGEEWEKAGLKGRIHFGLMLAQLVILVTVIILAVGFFMGWIYSRFSDMT